MLKITIPAREYYDEERECFVNTKEQVLQLEHSLLSLSKWESKYCKPFLGREAKKTDEETLDYIRCMTLTQNVDPHVYENMTAENVKEVVDYIDHPMTATWFNERTGIGSNKSEVVTAEIIYYWMIAFNIPFECQKWHLNRLITLIKVCSYKSEKPKKVPMRESLSERAKLNEARKALWNTKG